MAGNDSSGSSSDLQDCGPNFRIIALFNVCSENVCVHVDSKGYIAFFLSHNIGGCWVCTDQRATTELLHSGYSSCNFYSIFALQKWDFQGYSNPIKKNGLILLKYGFNTGSIRVGKTRGFGGNPGFYGQKYGLILLKYGFNTSSILVKIQTLSFLRKFSFKIEKWDQPKASTHQNSPKSFTPRKPQAVSWESDVSIHLECSIVYIFANSYIHSLTRHFATPMDQQVPISDMKWSLEESPQGLQASPYMSPSGPRACLRTPLQMEWDRSWAARRGVADWTE